MNRSQIIGNAAGDAEVRFTQSGTAVANFRVATNEVWKDKSGQKQERTEWHRVVVWGKLAELCGENVKKGTPLFVEGRLETREWQDKTHPDVKHHTTEIVADQVKWFGRRERSGPPAPSDADAPPSGRRSDEDIPF